MFTGTYRIKSNKQMNNLHRKREFMLQVWRQIWQSLSICDAPWHFVPKCGKTWRPENALQKWRNLRNCTLLRNLYVSKLHLLTSRKAQEAHAFYDFFAKKYLIMDWKIYTCNCLNNYLTIMELEELDDYLQACI